MPCCVPASSRPATFIRHFVTYAIGLSPSAAVKRAANREGDIATPWANRFTDQSAPGCAWISAMARPTIGSLSPLNQPAARQNRFHGHDRGIRPLRYPVGRPGKAERHFAGFDHGFLRVIELNRAIPALHQMKGDHAHPGTDSQESPDLIRARNRHSPGRGVLLAEQQAAADAHRS